MTEIRRKTSAALASRRGRALLGAGAAALLMFAAGCRQDMQDDPKMFPQRGTTFFADMRSVRPQVDHTVARGQLDQDQYFYTGLVNGNQERDLMPFPVTMQVLERGQERYNVYCSPCHSRVGNGLGMIVDRGYKVAANFHDAKRLAQPLSHYFYVMTNGYGAMPDYSAQLTPQDRWAVAAYIRALQLSQDASMANVPAGKTVRSLKDIAAEEGYPASFAEPWPLPTDTDVMVLPPDQSQGAPGLGPAQNTPVQQQLPPDTGQGKK